MDTIYAVAALSLGIATSLHPCLALLNLGAFSLICGPVDRSLKMIAGGLLFILGRVTGYIGVALLFMAGAAFSPQAAQSLRYYGNALMGPLFIIMGMIISGLLGTSRSARAFIEMKARSGFFHYISLFVLGIIHAVSFCPVSAGFFFGILLPLSSEHNSFIVNIFSYGIGTGLPLFILIIMTASGKNIISRYSKHQALLERWIKPVSGAVVIVIGIYLTLSRVFNI